MFNNAEEKLRNINRKIIITNLVGAPGSILVALGLYGKFAVNGDAFISILNEEKVVHGCLVLGGIIMIWELLTFIRLAIQKSEIQKQMKGSDPF